MDATVDATVDGTVGGPRQDEPRQAERRERARGVLMARLTRELTHLASPPREVVILDARSGRPLEANDTTRRFFEAAWVVTKDDGERSGGERSGSGIDGSSGGSGGGIDGKSGNGGAVLHYLIYSTGDTHHLVYATSNRSIEAPTPSAARCCLRCSDGLRTARSSHSIASGGYSIMTRHSQAATTHGGTSRLPASTSAPMAAWRCCGRRRSKQLLS